MKRIRSRIALVRVTLLATALASRAEMGFLHVCNHRAYVPG